jgi:hypothetical protein
VSESWKPLLRDAWAELSVHVSQARQFKTKRLSATDVTSAYAGMRSVDNAPCLLVEGVVSPALLFELGGMRLGAYQGDPGALIVLTLEDPDQADMFLSVCSDVLSAASVGSDDGYLSRFLGRLDAWRRFLRERHAGLSRNATVGLIGELLVLELLLTIRLDLLLSWVAPDDGLHDFICLGRALEVKTSMGPASRIRISTLDQLEPTGLETLTLMHVRLVERTDGRSLGALITDLNTALTDEGSRQLLANALLKRGLMPDDESALKSPKVNLQEFAAYRVDEAFPKLTRKQVPSAVVEAEYSLDLRAIASYAFNSGIAIKEFAGSI